MGKGPTEAYHKDLMDGFIRGSLTCLSGRTIREEINPEFPLMLNIEPTSACNLRCYVCPRHRSSKPVGYMDFELYRRIIEQCAEQKPLRMLNFHKDGESLLHPRIFEMIRYAKDRHAARVLHINTNAMCLTDDKIEPFLRCGIDDVTISLDAFRPETFRKLKGVNALDRVERNVRRLFEKKRKLNLDGPFIRVKIMEFEDTKEEISDFVRKWTPIADDVQVTGLHDWAGTLEGVNVTDDTQTGASRFPCVLLWYMMAVNWNGTVSVCNFDWDCAGIVGDCRRQSLSEIWNGEPMKKYRRHVLNRQYDKAGICGPCTFWCGEEDLTEYFLGRKEFYEPGAKSIKQVYAACGEKL